MLLPVLLLVFLLQPASGHIDSKLHHHYSDVLKIKCDALPYRTVFHESNCYFVIDAEFDSVQTSKQCSLALTGSKLTGSAPSAVFEVAFVSKNEFVKDDETTDKKKKAMCFYESRFRCSTGEKTSIAGKCLYKGEKKMTYKQATTFCAGVGSLPYPVNDAENRDIAAASSSSIWLRPAYSKTWSGRIDFSKFGACFSLPFYAAQDPKACSAAVAATSNAAATARGYWALAEQTELLDVLCIGEANNTDFWTAPLAPAKTAKSEIREEEDPLDCKTTHKWDEKTRRCRWSGPANVCVQIFNNDNPALIQLIRIPNYPNTSIVGIDMSFDEHKYYATYFPQFENRATRAIVRRGCMATFWMHPLHDFPFEMKLLSNVEYGDYQLPNPMDGTIEMWGGNGLSRVSCYCDPYETEKEKPVKKDCVEHHEWSEKKQRCVWTLDDKYAGEIESYDGKRLKLEIPNWPFNKRFDLNLQDAKLTDFEYKVTRNIVRQGCFCTIYSGPQLNSGQCSGTKGYGDHDVASFYANDPLDKVEKGSMRIVCECMNGDSGKDRLIRTPESPKCPAIHEYSEKTKRCEWTGPEKACVHMTNTRNQTEFLTMKDWPKYPSGRQDFFRGEQPWYSSWNKQLTWITVRRGCEASVWWGDYGTTWYYNTHKIIKHAGYGTFRVPQKDFGDVEMEHYNNGASQVYCNCDAALLSQTPASPKTRCLEGHAYDEHTGQCEWTRDKKIAAIIWNDQKQSMNVEIPNWPTEKFLRWWMPWAIPRVQNASIFNNRINRVVVRQHCFVQMITGDSRDVIVGGTVGYGIHAVAGGAQGIIVSCIE